MALVIIPSFPVTVHITVGADQPPVGVADAYTTAEDTFARCARTAKYVGCLF